MADERYLYTELLRAIHKKGDEVLGYGDEEEIHHQVSFSIDSLLSSMDSDVRKYEQTLRMLLARMVHERILEGTVAQYHTTPLFQKEYEEKAVAHL